MQPSYGVVVLTMGTRHDELQRGLQSLLAQQGVELDIVVVGNSWQPVGLPQGVRALGLSENLGIPAGRNAGVPMVSGEFLFFLDDDAWLPDPMFLRTIAERFAAVRLRGHGGSGTWGRRAGVGAKGVLGEADA